MDVVNRVGNRLRDLSDNRRSNPPLLREVRQCSPFNEFHREERDAVVLTDLVNGHKIGMPQASDSLGFILESTPGFRRTELSLVDHLQCHDPSQLVLTCLVDDPHSATVNNFKNLILADAARGQGDGTGKCGGHCADPRLIVHELQQLGRAVRITAQPFVGIQHPALRKEFLDR